jgi:hypothetical protein
MLLIQDILRLFHYQLLYLYLEDKNSFAQIRLGTYNADKRDFTTALKYLNKAKQSSADMRINIKIDSFFKDSEYLGILIEFSIDVIFLTACSVLTSKA